MANVIGVDTSTVNRHQAFPNSVNEDELEAEAMDADESEDELEPEELYGAPKRNGS